MQPRSPDGVADDPPFRPVGGRRTPNTPALLFLPSTVFFKQSETYCGCCLARQARDRGDCDVRRSPAWPERASFRSEKTYGHLLPDALERGRAALEAFGQQSGNAD